MELSQVSIAKIFWTVLAVEAVAFIVLLTMAFRSGSSGPEGLVGAWIVLVPPVIWAILAWLFQQSDSPAMCLAYTALLVFLHGKADTSFDWAQRPFFLTFNTEDRGARETAFRELFRMSGAAADPYLRA